ncbi:MAG: hypothetical protein AAAFM81_05315 [Pseudomonadota bacterium]
MFTTHLSSRPVIALLAVCGLLTSPNADAGNSLVVPIAESELVSVISIVPKAGEAAANARNIYLKEAFGLAQQHGLQPHGALAVTEAIVGEFQPRAVAFYRWPSAEAESTFEALPEWAPIKATRPDGWDELRIHDRVATNDATLEFSDDKFYTMASAWIDPGKPDDYLTYLGNIEPAMASVGGKFFFHMSEPSFSSLTPDLAAPSRVTIVEWDSREALDAFLNTALFKKNASLLTSGTVRFELLGLKVPDA